MVGYRAGAYNEATAQHDYMQAVFMTLRRRWISIILYTLALAGLLAMLVQFLPRSYRAVASVEVLSKTPLVANPDVFAASDAFTDETVGTELGVLESQELRTTVVQKLNLTANPEFNPDLAPSRVDQAVAAIKTLSWFHYVPSGWLPEAQSVPPANQLFDTIATFAKHVKAEPVSHSRIIQVAAISRDRQLAAAIANETVAAYVAYHRQQKMAAYAEAFNFAQQRLPALKAGMIEKSARVDRFRQDHNMVSGQYAAIRREKLSEVSKQVVDAQNKLQQLRADAAQAKVTDALSNPAVLGSLTVQRLREQRSQIVAEGAARPAAWASNYALRANAVDGQIRAEAARIVAGLSGQVAAQQAAVNSQLAAYTAIQLEVGEMDKLQSELDPLENDARIAVKQYNDFTSSDSATKPDVAFVGVNVRVLSTAATPYRPYFPDNMLMLPAACVLSFGLVSGLALFRGREAGFTSGLQLQEALHMAPIGRIPYRTRRMERAYWEAMMSSSMRLFPPYDEHNSKQTILVTSAQPDEGKTTIAQGLAEVLIRRNISVALVDADMRVVRAPRRGQAAPVAGLGDVLRATTTLDEVLVRRPGISLVPAGSSPANSGALIASRSMAQLLAALEATHDVVIIDGPPAPVGGDVYALSRLVKRVLFVIKQSDTTGRQLEQALAAMDKAPEDLSIVLNMIRTTGDDDGELALSPRMIKYYASSETYYPRA